MEIEIILLKYFLRSFEMIKTPNLKLICMVFPNYDSNLKKSKERKSMNDFALKSLGSCFRKLKGSLSAESILLWFQTPKKGVKSFP